MAKSPKAEVGQEAEPSQPSLVVALLISGVIAAAAGAGFAFVFLTKKTEPAAAAAPAAAAEHAKAKDATSSQPIETVPGRFPADAVEMPLDPIVTSIGPQAKSRMRLEASVMLKKTAGPQPSLKKELSEDIVTFLNSVNVEQISGIRGFQNLRDDLNDRAKIRGRGAVLGLLISGFVLE